MKARVGLTITLATINILIWGFLLPTVVSAQTFQADSSITIEVNGDSYTLVATNSDLQWCIDEVFGGIESCVYYSSPDLDGSLVESNSYDVTTPSTGVINSRDSNQSFFFVVNPSDFIGGATLYSGQITFDFSYDGQPNQVTFFQNLDGTISLNESPTDNGFELFASNTPAVIFESVKTGVQTTGGDVWPLFAIAGTPLAFIIGRGLIGIIR